MIITTNVTFSFTEATDASTPQDIPINGKTYPWIVAGVCAGVLFAIILLILTCLFALYCSRMRNSRQHHHQQTTRDGDNIKLNNNECYGCSPLPVGGMLEERENPSYELPLPVCMMEENPCYGYRNPYKISLAYENLYEVIANTITNT